MRITTVAMIGLLVAALVAGCQRPGWEVRTFRGGTAVTTDATFQQNMSKIRGRWVCPYCGYSTNVVSSPSNPGTCPNPWSVSGHPANVTLEYKPVEDSFLTTSSAGYLVGLPFHPKTGSNVDGSIVHAAAAGLLSNPNIQAGDYVRFLFLMPGAKYPAARAESVNTAGGLSITPDNVHLNPYRVTDGEKIYVQRAVENLGGAYNVQVVVWSDLDGLEFFAEFAGVGAVPAGRRVVSATGSAVIDLPAFPTPNPGDPPDVDYCIITVKSNCVVVPHEPAPDPGGWGSWFSTIPEPFDNCFEVPAAGSPGDRVADWLSDVVGTGNPIGAATGFYQIPEGAVGKGWVFVLWRKQGYDAVVADGNLAPGCNYGDSVWYDGPDVGQAPTEWNYDWLVESNNPASRDHLWGNCAAVADPTNSLENYHTPGAAGGQYTPTDPPWYMACAFISSRVHVPLTGEIRAESGTPIEPDNDPNSGIARVFLGERSGTQVGGSYAPGSITAARRAAVSNRMSSVLRCPECGSVTPNQAGASVCPYCGANLTAADASSRVALAVDQPLSLLRSAGNPNPRSNLVSPASIPVDAVKCGPTVAQLVPGADRVEVLALWVDLPRATVPSVPPLGADGVRPRTDTNDGYVGRLVIYHNDEPLAPGATLVLGPNRLDVQDWARGYRCPSCGTWHSESQVPGPCTNVAGPNACRGYRVCPVCAVASPIPDPPTGTTTCPFCGRQLDSGDNFGPTDTFCGAPRITEEDLDAEEYEAFEIQVSVQREFMVAGGASGVELGRVAPGVVPAYPDTTVRDDGVVPAEPADVSIPPRPFSIVNSGNVRGPVTLQGEDLVRADTDAARLSAAGLAGRLPFLSSLVDLLRWNETAFSNVPLVPAAAGAAAGEPAGAKARAGDRSVVPVEPVPLGQPAGTHAGGLVALTDLDGDGTPDTPLGNLDASVRVGEARIPQNDYFSADVAPMVAFDLDNNGEPKGLHLVWMTNRPPSAGVDANAPPLRSGDAPPPDAPFNLVYANAALVAPGGLYRHYEWESSPSGGIAEAKALTVDGTGAINEAPFVLTLRQGSTYERMVFWHWMLPTEGGWDSVLRFVGAPTSGYASGTTGVVHTAADMQALRALAVKDAAGALSWLWLFWHQGPRGHETIYHLPHFDPQAPRSAEARPLPVSLSYVSKPHDEREEVRIPGLNGLMSVHRFAASPFTYVRDPYAWFMPDPGSGLNTDLLNVAFTGHVRQDENTDICWVRFDWDDSGLGPKVAFPRLEGRVDVSGSGVKAGECLEADAKRQVFSSRHLEWAVHDDGPSDNFGREPTASFDPRLYLTARAGGDVFVYEITWVPGDPPQQRWVRERNAYLVQPRFRLVHSSSGNDVLAVRAYPGDGAGPYRLVDPPTAGTPNPQPLMAEITPATGVVTFSSPLFNSEAPDDASAVLNTGNCAGISDVQLYADYTPLVWRICRDPAADDSPYAFWQPQDTGGLTVFWRRTFSVADPPFENRSIFLYKQFAPAVQLQYPPVSGTVQYWDGSSWQDLPTPRYVTYEDTGYIADTEMTLTALPHSELLQYSGAGGQRQERRVFVGWTQERRVPIEAEVTIGPFSAAQETYTVRYGPQPADRRTVTRFWLAWSSPRAVYDLRPANAPDPDDRGGDWRQSADVYLATVVPNLHAAVAEPLR